MTINQSEIIQLNTEDGRYYEFQIDGVIYKLISVTTVLGQMLSKPALIPWAFNLGIEETVAYVNQVVLEEEPTGLINTPAVKEYLKEQDRSVKKITEQAANRGTYLHSYLEARIKGTDLPECWVDGADPYEKQIEKFLDDYAPDFHECELKVFSTEFGFAGTLDVVCTIRKHPPRRKHKSLVGKKVILDLKTNKEGRVYPESNFPQIDAYGIAYRSMGNEFDEGVILAVGEKNFGISVNYYPEGVFLKILDAFNAIEEAKKMKP